MDVVNEIARAEEDLKKAQERLTRLRADLEASRDKLSPKDRGFFLARTNGDLNRRIIVKLEDNLCLVLGHARFALPAAVITTTEDVSKLTCDLNYVNRLYKGFKIVRDDLFFQYLENMMGGLDDKIT